MRFVLVHSPLTGPATWSWVADDLRSKGHEAVVPDLRRAVGSGRPESVVNVVTAAAGAGPAALAGHSGAGFFLPSIAERLDPHPVMVFVDAGMPPCQGNASAGGKFLDQLRSLAVDGILPRWSTWWGDDVMRMLVPDDVRRARIVEEMPAVPLVLYESPVDMPAGWCHAPGAYILLSETYREDAERARSRGWRTLELLGSHLDIVTKPDEVAQGLLELTD